MSISRPVRPDLGFNFEGCVEFSIATNRQQALLTSTICASQALRPVAQTPQTWEGELSQGSGHSMRSVTLMVLGRLLYPHAFEYHEASPLDLKGGILRGGGHAVGPKKEQ